MQDVIDLLDVAAKNYPIKALAPDIGKAESTLRNELTQQDGYKLGLITTYQILKFTHDYRALDRLEKLLGRVAFTLPTLPHAEDMSSLMQLMGKMAQEFGAQIAYMGEAMADGKLTKGEIRDCRDKLYDAILAAVKLKTYLEAM